MTEKEMLQIALILRHQTKRAKVVSMSDDERNGRITALTNVLEDISALLKDSMRFFSLAEFENIVYSSMLCDYCAGRMRIGHMQNLDNQGMFFACSNECSSKWLSLNGKI